MCRGNISGMDNRIMLGDSNQSSLRRNDIEMKPFWGRLKLARLSIDRHYNAVGSSSSTRL